MLVIGRTICGVHENFSLPSNISGKIISIVKVLLEKYDSEFPLIMMNIKSIDFKRSTIYKTEKPNSHYTYKSQSVQSPSHVPFFAIPRTSAHRASLSITNSGSCSDSHQLSWWCHPTISSSAVPFSSCFQYFPASGSFLMSQVFSSSGQSIGA